MHTLKAKHTLTFLFLISLLQVSQAKTAEDAIVGDSFEATNSVDESVLDGMRGGFVTPDGIKLDLGFQRTTLVDGAIQEQSIFRVQNIDVLGKNATAIPSGDLANLSTAMNSVIQNNLDNKVLQVNTNLDVIVKNMDVVHLQQGLMNATSINGIHDMQTLH